MRDRSVCGLMPSTAAAPRGFEVADRVLVIHEGKVHQNGTPEELLLSPESDFVREFLGEARLLDGKVAADGSIVVDPMALPTTSAPGTAVRVSVRGARVVERPTIGDGIP